MIEGRQGLRFAGEPDEPFGVAREEIEQHFDRDIAIERRIARAIDLAHAARPERSQDLVGAESGTGGEGQALALDYTGRASARTGLLLCDADLAINPPTRLIRRPFATREE